MDAAEIGVLIGGVASILFTLWFFFGGQSEKNTPAQSGAITYACPMHPWITSTEASAECSICGMKLVRRD
jgi:hypothetical protein